MVARDAPARRPDRRRGPGLPTRAAAVRSDRPARRAGPGRWRGHRRRPDPRRREGRVHHPVASVAERGDDEPRSTACAARVRRASRRGDHRGRLRLGVPPHRPPARTAAPARSIRAGGLCRHVLQDACRRRSGWASWRCPIRSSTSAIGWRRLFSVQPSSRRPAHAAALHRGRPPRPAPAPGASDLPRPSRDRPRSSSPTPSTPACSCRGPENHAGLHLSTILPTGVAEDVDPRRRPPARHRAQQLRRVLCPPRPPERHADRLRHGRAPNPRTRPSPTSAESSSEPDVIRRLRRAGPNARHASVASTWSGRIWSVWTCSRPKSRRTVEVMMTPSHPGG